MVGEIKAGKKAIEELQKHKEQIHNQIRKLEKMIEEGQQGGYDPEHDAIVKKISDLEQELPKIEVRTAWLRGPVTVCLS
jgi:uncharacterized coiled-coil DUF342 family protein